MIDNRSSQLSDLLDKIAAAIDLPEELYARAYRTYQEIGDWLCEPESALTPYEPHVYIQGSMRQGTANRPMLEGEEVDADAVALLFIKKEGVTQERLKNKVGDRLKENTEYRPLLEEKRRCWTLDYPDDFHIDILPAIPDEEGMPEAILITDKELRLWQHSNPIGFADWFLSRTAIQFKQHKEAIAIREGLSIEEIPDYRVKTPLQRSVQLLKRHRDVYFQNDPEDKPVSIAITTLAGRAYGGEGNLLEAFANIALTMRNYIEKKDGKYIISNPVQPEENFADKWADYPERQEKFFKWLDQLEADFKEVVSIQGLHSFGDKFGSMFGEHATKDAFRQLGLDIKTQRDEGKLKMTKGTAGLSSVGEITVPKHNFHGEEEIS